MKAVIIAGGKGTRLGEISEEKNKAMLEIYGKTLLESNLDRAVEGGVKEIILVLCYQSEQIIQKIREEYRGIKVNYVIEKKGEGIVNAIKNAKECIGNSDFLLMLGDEILIDADIKGMIKKFRDEDLFAVCGIIYDEDKSSIRKTYSVMADKSGRIFRLVEKPRFPTNNFKGTGHCVFKNEILDYISRTPINMYRNQKEMVDLIQCAIDDGKMVKIHKIAEDYFNINEFEDLNIAKESIKKSTPKVLVVHNQMKYFGGAELLIVEMCNWLTKMGIKNDILTLSSSKDVENALLNTEIIVIKNEINLQPPGYRNMTEILTAIRLFRKNLKKIEKNYEVINFHDFPVTWSLWPRKKPAIWFMNLPPNLYSKPDAGFFYKILNRLRIWLDRFMIRHSMDIITVAERANQIRAKQRYGLNARLIDFGINYEFFSEGNPKEITKRFNLKNKFVVIHPGMFCDVKNQIESLKAIKEVRDKIPNILLVLTGKTTDIEYTNKIKEFIKQNSLEKNVLIVGYLKTREELRDLYATSNIGLFPTKKQGGILVPFEISCAGVPIIVSEDIEVAELIKTNDLGIITKKYSEAILEIYNNSEKYQQRAEKTKLFVKNNLSWKAFTEKMISCYIQAWKKYKKD